MQLTTKTAPISTINPAAYNPRKITASQLQKLKLSLQEFGFVQPLIVNTTTGNLVGGHQRLKAAKEIGYTEVPIVEIACSVEREKALNIALNKISGEWDYEQLVPLLAELEPGTEFDLTGFDIDEFQQLENLYYAEGKAGREGKTPPPPRNPNSMFGEVYQLGEHILVCGDSTDPAAYEHTTETTRMMFTDPPYNIAYEGDTDEKLTIMNDAFSDRDSYRDFLVAFLLCAQTKNDGVSYVCYAATESEPVFGAWRLANMHLAGTSGVYNIHAKAPKKERGNPTVILWDKDGFSLGRSHYHAGHEPILYGWHQNANNKYWCGDRTQSTVWTYPKPAANREHPTMKPVDLVERAIRNSSQPGDWVLDPFGGSGSTLIAAENIGRRCYTIEMDPRFVDVIVERYNSLEGAGPVTRIVDVDGSLPFNGHEWIGGDDGDTQTDT